MAPLERHLATCGILSGGAWRLELVGGVWGCAACWCPLKDWYRRIPLGGHVQTVHGTRGYVHTAHGQPFHIPTCIDFARFCPKVNTISLAGYRPPGCATPPLLILKLLSLSVLFISNCQCHHPDYNAIA